MRILSNPRSRNLGLSAGLSAFLLGFLATSFQIYLLREFSAHFYGNELTFGFVLASWLLWGGVGSLLGRRIGGKLPDMASLYMGSLVLFLVSLAVLRFSRFILGHLPGEVTGLAPALGFALVLGFLLSFPLGLFFVFNSRHFGGDSSRVYLLESFGATAAGFVVHFLLVPHFSNWEGAALVAGLSSLILFLVMGAKKRTLLLLTACALSTTAYFLDFPSQRLVWKPFSLIASTDTPYGKLQVLKTEEQLSFYGNGLRMFSHPAPAAAEEAVHFAMLQNSDAEDILLIGGGIGGSVREILKYPSARIEYVEINPAAIKLAERFLPREELAFLRNPRVRIFLKDGRTFLKDSKKPYDAIILHLPEPATAQLNRFYTYEFFLLARERLRPAGVLSFVLPSSENYISPDLREFLQSIYGTLNLVFGQVRVVPGDNNVFLASKEHLEIGAGILEAKMGALGLRNKIVRPGIISARLNPLRVSSLEQQIRTGPFRLNRDFVPVSYYFASVLWTGQFGGVETRILKLFAGLPAFWTLHFPIILFGAVLLCAAVKTRADPARLLLPLAAMGFTSILVEMAVLVVFQASFGSLYGRISLLLAVYMAGLSIGALAGSLRRNPGAVDLLLYQGGFLILLVPMSGALQISRIEALPYLFLLAFGFLGGGLFTAANRMSLEGRANPGLGYGLDLLGSFAGLLLASGIIIPLSGIPAMLKALVILNGLCLLYFVSLGVGRSRS